MKKFKSIKVQQLKTGTIQNATIKENIIMGLSSSLEINKYVKLDDSTLNLSYNEEYSQLTENAAQIKGTINSTPKNILMVQFSTPKNILMRLMLKKFFQLMQFQKVVPINGFFLN